MRHNCPRCGTLAPALIVLTGWLTPFRCKGCGASIRNNTSRWIAVPAFLAFWRVQQRTDDAGTQALWFITITLAIMLYVMLMARIELADQPPA